MKTENRKMKLKKGAAYESLSTLIVYGPKKLIITIEV
jgi:hypothetical protein